MKSTTQVLLVENDPDWAHLVGRALAEAACSFEITHVTTLAAAKQHLASASADVVVLDLGLPDGFGLQNLAAMQAADDSLPIVILTSHEDHDLAIQAVREGAQDYLTKDFMDSGHLARALTCAIDRKQTELSLRAGVCRLQEAALMDPLTCLPNRRALYQHLHDWKQPEHPKLSVASVVVLDIDYFKRINDAYGHNAGDAGLVHVGSLLQAESESLGMACRYGGEEFCVILEECCESAAAIWADRVREILLSAPIVTPRATFTLTASFGVAQFDPADFYTEQEIDRADQALLVSKQRGRNRVTVYSHIDDRLSEQALSQTESTPFLSALARDYMTTPVGCLRVDDSMISAAKELLDKGLNSMPVVDDNARLVGIISEKDLIEATPSEGFWNRRVADVMNATVVSFSADTPVETIRAFLTKVPMRRIVIVDGEKPVGVLSRSNLLRCYYDWALSKVPTKPATAATAPR